MDETIFSFAPRMENRKRADSDKEKEPEYKKHRGREGWLTKNVGRAPVCTFF